MELVHLLFILILSIFLGFALISVFRHCFTPLMSEANAICGIIIIGALIAAGSEANDTLTIILGTSAVALCPFNVIGGLFSNRTHVKMFKRKTANNEYRNLN